MAQRAMPLSRVPKKIKRAQERLDVLVAEMQRASRLQRVGEVFGQRDRSVAEVNHVKGPEAKPCLEIA